MFNSKSTSEWNQTLALKSQAPSSLRASRCQLFYSACTNVDAVTRFLILASHTSPKASGSVVEIAASFDALGSEGFTLTHLAAAFANSSLLAMLAAFGRRERAQGDGFMHAETHCTNMTPLLVAALHGHADIASLLLAHGADVTDKYSYQVGVGQ